MVNNLLPRICFKKTVITLLSSLTIVANINIDSSWADDPFRNSDRREIGDNTEAAFIAFFREGNYRQGKVYLDRAIKTEAEEPLLWTLLAAYNYLQGDRESLKKYSIEIKNTAKEIGDRDALRGNLYEGIALLIEGAYIYETQGAFNSIGKLQQALKKLDAAGKIDNTDPEYNLFRGYLDLLLASNSILAILASADTEESIVNLEEYAAPNYVADRGIAIAYRDLKKYETALEYADRALESAPENPELYYLQGQILRILGTKKEDKAMLQRALVSLEKALSKADRLPPSLRDPIQGEYDKTQDRIAELN